MSLYTDAGCSLRLFSCTGFLSAAPQYNVTTLIPIGINQPMSVGYDINDKGSAVGNFWPPYGGSSHAFLYSGGSMSVLGANGPYGCGYGINDNGQVVGNIYVGSFGTSHAFLYEDGQIRDLGTLAGYGESHAYGINASKQVVGDTRIVGGLEHAFVYSGGEMTDLGTLGGPQSCATAINSRGQVVGRSCVGPGTNYDPQHAFLWDSSAGEAMVDLGTMSGYNSSEATGISSTGVIVGWAYNQEATYPQLPYDCDGTAFLYSEGTMTNLGSLPDYPHSIAYGVNSAGQVVGTAFDGPSGLSRAFLYRDGVMMDLSALIDPTLGWTISDARSINDSGWIVGTMGNYAVLLTPTPEPSSLVLFAIAAGSLFAYAWRRQAA